MTKPAAAPYPAAPGAPVPAGTDAGAASNIALHEWLPHLARPLGWTGLAAFIVIALLALMLGFATSSFTIETVVQLVGFAAFAVVGTILLEQAAHPIGWICLAIGLGGASARLLRGTRAERTTLGDEREAGA